MNNQRRQILIRCGAAAAATLGVPALRADERSSSRTASGVDVHIELQAIADRVAIRPGAPTRVWRYQGKLLRGDAGVLEASVGAYLGPIIRVRRGQRVRIDLINGLPESTIIHWHGLHVPEAMDGHPRFEIGAGERYVYDFTVVNRAGSYWFHPHPHGRTGKQVYFGLAGLFLVSDDEEDALGLPTGAQDLPLVIQDRSFDDDNQLIYLSDSLAAAPTEGSDRRAMVGGMGGMGGMGRMMASMMGMFGDQILVNGRPDASLELAPRPYRLRLLDGSNSRIYKLAWADRSPLTVIGTDGGLLAAPLQRDHIMLAPAERLDLWVDFGRWPAGTELTLQSLAFDSGMGGMMGGMMGGAALPDGRALSRAHRAGARRHEGPGRAAAATSVGAAAAGAARRRQRRPPQGLQPHDGHDDLGHQRPGLRHARCERPRNRQARHAGDLGVPERRQHRNDGHVDAPLNACARLAVPGDRACRHRHGWAEPGQHGHH